MIRCPHCTFDYARQSALDKHVATIHAGMPADVTKKAAQLEKREAQLKNLPEGARLCATGCGFYVRTRTVKYAESTRAEQTFIVLIHTGYAPEQYPQIERCRAS